GGYIRLLGFNAKGQKYLNQIKGDLEWPLITKINDDVVADFIQMDFRGGMLTQMINGASQDFYRHPVILE
ncbi:nucleotidyltransferase family protein, partial [Staphylococcus haemolyticus]